MCKNRVNADCPLRFFEGNGQRFDLLNVGEPQEFGADPF